MYELLGELSRELACVGENIALVEGQEGVQLFRPLLHGHGLAARGLVRRSRDMR